MGDGVEKFIPRGIRNNNPGNIKKNDPFFDMAYKYIRNISLLSSNKMRFSIDDTTNNFTLLNSF